MGINPDKVYVSLMNIVGCSQPAGDVLMLALPDVLSGNDCPCSSTLVGALYRATPDQYEGVIETIPLDVRAVLALYCYRRAHLQAIGLAIAATCEESDLRVHGQSAGSALFHRARQIHQDPLPSAFRVRKTVTLSLGVLKNGVFDEEDEVIEPFDDLPASPNVQQIRLFPITNRGGELDATPALNPRSRPA